MEILKKNGDTIVRAAVAFMNTQQQRALLLHLDLQVIKLIAYGQVDASQTTLHNPRHPNHAEQ